MNEDGSLIIFTLMVLALLTIVGMASIRTANTEIEIAGSELLYQRNFYLAEGAAMEAVNRLADPANTITTSSGPNWMVMTPGLLNAGNIDTYWDGAMPASSDVDPDGSARYIAAYEGIAAGSSLDMSKTKLHDISIYGRSQNRGVSEIRLGYRKAF